MAQPRRRPKPLALQFAVAGFGLVILVGTYLLAMQLSLDVSTTVDSPASLDRRDEVYGLIHFGILLVAIVAGFAVGKWLNGLGLAYGALFFVVLATAMVAAQLGSHELACRGHNDVLRHWQCGTHSGDPPQIPTPS
jgi:hypothetical protein